MPVNYTTPPADQLHPVAGVRLGVTMAGIRKKDRRDLTLLGVLAVAVLGLRSRLGRSAR